MSTYQQWIDLAEELGQKGKDLNVPVGCVIVNPDDTILSTGWNHIPFGIENSDPRYKKPAKYFWVEHAERNAIYNAARDGVSLAGSTAYINFSPQSICTNCVRALIQSGVIRFVGPNHGLNARGKTVGGLSSKTVSRRMIEEANIEIIVV